jgi:hypothetical protein
MIAGGSFGDSKRCKTASATNCSSGSATIVTLPQPPNPGPLAQTYRARTVVARPRVELHLAVTAAQEAGEEVLAGAAVRSPIGIDQLGANPVGLPRTDDRRPLRLRHDLPQVFSPATYARRHQDAPQRLRSPLLAGDGWYPARDQLPIVRRQINVPGHGRQLRLLALAQVDEVLQLARMRSKRSA